MSFGRGWWVALLDGTAGRENTGLSSALNSHVKHVSKKLTTAMQAEGKMCGKPSPKSHKAVSETPVMGAKHV